MSQRTSSKPVESGVYSMEGTRGIVRLLSRVSGFGQVDELY